MSRSLDVNIDLPMVPVNCSAIVSESDLSVLNSISYNESGLSVFWNFTTTSGAITKTAIAITQAGTGPHDWVNLFDGFYCIEIPASGGSVNNNLTGTGFISGELTGAIPFRGPDIEFKAAGLNNLLMNNAYNAALGLSGTNLDKSISSALGAGQYYEKNTSSDIQFTMLQSDGITPAIGRTVTVQKMIGTGAFTATTGTITEGSLGAYTFTASAADLNGDDIMLIMTAAGCAATTISVRTFTA